MIEEKDSAGYNPFVDKVKQPLPPLNNVHELAIVIVVGTIICNEIAAQLPVALQEKSVDAIVAETEKHNNEYIGHHFGIGQGADVR